MKNAGAKKSILKEKSDGFKKNKSISFTGTPAKQNIDSSQLKRSRSHSKERRSLTPGGQKCPWHGRGESSLH